MRRRGKRGLRKKERKMSDNFNENEKGLSVIDIFSLIKRYIVLILAIVITTCVVGVAFAKIRTPKYTSSETLSYNVSIDGRDKKTTAEANNIINYYDTMEEFFTTGIVMDRADYYYYRYRKSAEYSTGELDAFIAKIKTESYNDFFYSKEKGNYKKVFSKDNVSIKSAGSDTMANYVLSVTDASKDEVVSMLRLYALSITVEAKDLISGIDSEIIENGATAPVKDISTLKIFLISGVIGVVIAFVAVYLLCITDNSVKSEEQLAELSGVNLLANIPESEEV